METGRVPRAWTIAKPQPDESPAAARVIAAAFGRPDEARLVERLRAEGAVLTELVARSEPGIVGHVMFSRLEAEPATLSLAGLAPLAVTPGRQRAGIGAALVHAGLAACRALGVEAVAVLGDPAYYGRFGFAAGLAKPLQAPYSGPAFQALELRDRALAAGPWRVRYPGAFA